MLGELIRSADLAVHDRPDVDAIPIAGITADSRRVTAGYCFVAIDGTTADGAAFVADAIAAGASAIVATASDQLDVPDKIPVVVVADTRIALARLASAFHGHPQRALRLIGVTGTLGKTSTVALLETALTSADETVSLGVIGSLGAHITGPAAARVSDDAFAGVHGMTTPDATTLFAALRTMVDAGVQLVAMEVTSHALAQHRVEGLHFALGLFTNLVPDEHLEYHGSADDYITTKSRFLDLMLPGAPFIVNADDALLLATIAQRPAAGRQMIGVSMDPANPVATVVVDTMHTDAGGATFALRLRAPLPRLAGASLPAETIVPVVLPVLGVQQVINAAFAATAAIVVGAQPERITEALADVEPIQRRMHVVQSRSPLVIDDTTGNPATLRAVFATIADLPRRSLRVLFGIRGKRGVEINRRLAHALAVSIRNETRRTDVTLVVTASDDVADERNRVGSDEQDAMLETLRRMGVAVHFETTLREAVLHIATTTHADDLILLLGAQGMDRASEMMLPALANYSSSSALRS